jgi:hypothetical protein
VQWLPLSLIHLEVLLELYALPGKHQLCMRISSGCLLLQNCGGKRYQSLRLTYGKQTMW